MFCCQLLQSESIRRSALLDELDETRRDRDDKLALLQSVEAGEYSLSLALSPRDEDMKAAARYAEVEAPPGEVWARTFIDRARSMAENNEVGTKETMWGFVQCALDAFLLLLREVGRDEEMLAARCECESLVLRLTPSSQQVDEAFLLGEPEAVLIKEAESGKLILELEAARLKERQLRDALKTQGDNMGLVLRRAAEFEASVIGNIRSDRIDALQKELENLSIELERRISSEVALVRDVEQLRVEVRLQEEELVRRHEAAVRQEHGLAVLERSRILLGETLDNEKEAIRGALLHACRRLHAVVRGEEPAESQLVLLSSQELVERFFALVSRVETPVDNKALVGLSLSQELSSSVRGLRVGMRDLRVEVRTDLADLERFLDSQIMVLLKVSRIGHRLLPHVLTKSV
jgi:hypothetical protein